MAPLISIITTIYNNERYIKNAVDSVLNQNFRDIEYIMVDDGSTDKTPEILDDIASLDKRIHVIHQSNQWIYAGFNNGIKAAKGKYIYILNSDDTMINGSLNKFAAIIEEYNPDVIYTPILVHVCDENQNIVVYDKCNWIHKVQKDEFINGRELYRDNWIKLNKLSLAGNQANLYRRDIMLKHPFRKDVYGADYLFNISIADDINSAYIMKTPVYNFFQYDSSEMNASVGKYYEYEHDMFNEFYSLNKELLQKWNRYDEEAAGYFIKKRLTEYSRELRSLAVSSCNLSLEDKLRKILNEYVETWIYKEVQDFHLEEEFEARTLSGIRALLCDGTIRQDSDMYFVYELLEGLLTYEKTEQDYIKIKRAVYNRNNPLNIGRIFYDKIKDKEKFE